MEIMRNLTSFKEVVDRKRHLPAQVATLMAVMAVLGCEQELPFDCERVVNENTERMWRIQEHYMAVRDDDHDFMRTNLTLRGEILDVMTSKDWKLEKTGTDEPFNRYHYRALGEEDVVLNCAEAMTEKGVFRQCVMEKKSDGDCPTPDFRYTFSTLPLLNDDTLKARKDEEGEFLMWSSGSEVILVDDMVVTDEYAILQDSRTSFFLGEWVLDPDAEDLYYSEKFGPGDYLIDFSSNANDTDLDSGQGGYYEINKYRGHFEKQDQRFNEFFDGLEK